VSSEVLSGNRVFTDFPDLNTDYTDFLFGLAQCVLIGKALR